jgi:hypothetical protein
MTEETQTQVVETQEVVPQVELNEVELKAMEHGWKPKGEFHDEGKKFVDAEEFLERQKFYDRIDSQNRKIKELERTVGSLAEHNRKIKEVAYKEALATLKSQKKEALEANDVDQVIEIDEKITDLKTQKVVEDTRVASTPNQPDPRFIAWVDRNKWYAQDVLLRKEADDIAIAYKTIKGDSVQAEDIIEFVEKQIKILHPEKFKNPNKSRESAVDSGNGSVSKTYPDTRDTFALTEDEERVMRTWVRQGIMTEKEYKQQLKDIKRGA